MTYWVKGTALFIIKQNGFVNYNITYSVQEKSIEKRLKEIYNNIEQRLLLGDMFMDDFIFCFYFFRFLYFTHFLKWPCVTL